MASNAELIQQIVEEASTKTGIGAQFLPAAVVLEVAVALATIWNECDRKDHAVAMIQRAAASPWSVAAGRVRKIINDASPEPCRCRTFADNVIAAAAARFRVSEVQD